MNNIDSADQLARQVMEVDYLDNNDEEEELEQEEDDLGVENQNDQGSPISQEINDKNLNLVDQLDGVAVVSGELGAAALNDSNLIDQEAAAGKGASLLDSSTKQLQQQNALLQQHQPISTNHLVQDEGGVLVGEHPSSTHQQEVVLGEEGEGESAMSSSLGMPQEQEIEDYARFLGMDPDQTIDREFMWIAKQGLMEPVPEPWQAMKDQNDNIVYVNKKTEQETHQHPCDDLYRQLFIKERSEYVKKMYGGADNVPAKIQHLLVQNQQSSTNNNPNPNQSSHLLQDNSAEEISVDLQQQPQNNLSNSQQQTSQMQANKIQVSSSNTKEKRQEKQLVDVENPSQGENSQREEVRDEVLDLGQNLTQSQSRDKLIVPAQNSTYPNNISNTAGGNSSDLNDLNSKMAGSGTSNTNQQNAQNNQNTSQTTTQQQGIVPSQNVQTRTSNLSQNQNQIHTHNTQQQTNKNGGGPQSLGNNSSIIGSDRHASAQQPIRVHSSNGPHHPSQHPPNTIYTVAPQNFGANYIDTSQGAISAGGVVGQGYANQFAMYQSAPNGLIHVAATAQPYPHALQPSSHNNNAAFVDASQYNNYHNQQNQSFVRRQNQAQKLETELKILRQSLKSATADQIEDIQRGYKFEIENLNQELTSEAEAAIALDIVKLQKAKELRLLQQEDFARKDAELETDKVRSRIEKMRQEAREHLEEEHKDSLHTIQSAYEKKLRMGLQKMQVRNEHLAEATQEESEARKALEQARKESERRLDRKRAQGMTQIQADLDQFRRSLNEQREETLVKIRRTFDEKLIQQKNDLETVRLEGQAKEESLRNDLTSRINQRLEGAREKAELEGEEQMRQMKYHNDLMFENKKKEIKNRVELEHQRKVNQMSLDGYQERSRSKAKLVDEHQLNATRLLNEEKRQIELEYDAKRKQLEQDSRISETQFTALERILAEIKALKQRIKAQVSQKVELESEISETQYESSKMEIKATSMKQRHIASEAKVEANLKNEFEKSKQELEYIEEQLANARKSSFQLDASKRAIDEKKSQNLAKDISKVKNLVTGIVSGTEPDFERASQSQQSENESPNVKKSSTKKDSYNEQVSELKRLLPTEIGKIASKVAKLEKEIVQLESCFKDLDADLFQGLGGATDKDEFSGPDGNGLGAWRRLNEFRSDMKEERKNIEVEVLKVKAQISHLRESKRKLTELAIKVNQVQLGGLKESSGKQESQLVSEFKHYLRQKLAISREEKDLQRMTKKGFAHKATSDKVDDIFAQISQVV